jgi:hypothetical protein
MSNIIPFTAGAQLPAYLKNRAALAHINADVASASSFPTLSIKGKVFTLSKDNQKKILTKPDDPDEVLQSINVAVIRANKNSRVYYSKAYSEDDSEGAKPTCYSSDGVTPAAGAMTPQAKKCQLCPHAVWGSKSGDTGKGTACSVNTRLAIADPDNVEEPWLLRVPAGSRSNFSDACKVADSRGLPYNAVVFKVGFDREAPSPKLTFKPIGLVADEAYEKLSALYDTQDVKEIVGLVDRRMPTGADAEPEAAPEADELDAAMAANPTAKAAQAAAPAPKAAKAPAVSSNDLDNALDGLVDEAPAPAPKPATKTKKVEAEVVEDAPVKPAKSTAKTVVADSGSLDDLLDNLDDILGGTDD